MCIIKKWNFNLFWWRKPTPDALIIGRITLHRRAVIGSEFKLVNLEELCDIENESEYLAKAIRIINRRHITNVFICVDKPNLVKTLLSKKFGGSVKFFKERKKDMKKLTFLPLAS